MSRGPLRGRPGKQYIMRCVGELFLHCCHNDDKREPAAAPNIHIANITFAVSDKSWCTIALLQFFVRPRGQKKDKRTLAKKTHNNKQTNKAKSETCKDSSSVGLAQSCQCLPHFWNLRPETNNCWQEPRVWRRVLFPYLAQQRLLLIA